MLYNENQVKLSNLFIEKKKTSYIIGSLPSYILNISTEVTGPVVNEKVDIHRTYRYTHHIFCFFFYDRLTMHNIIIAGFQS